MVCRTGDIEDEIHFYATARDIEISGQNFIRYLELNDHTCTTNLEDSDSIRDLFRTKKRIFLSVLENSLMTATEFGRP